MLVAQVCICWIKIVIQECASRHYCLSFCCLKCFMKSTSVLTSSSFTALYIDTLIPPTDLKMKDSVVSVAEMQSLTVFFNKVFQSGHLPFHSRQELPCIGMHDNGIEV